LRYAAELIGRGDKATPAKSNDDRLEISGATLTFILLAGTDYQMDPAKGFRSGQDPAKKLLLQQVDLALADSVDNKLYDSLRDRHRADFSGLMNRIVLDLGSPVRQDAHRAARRLPQRQGRPASGDAAVPVRPLPDGVFVAHISACKPARVVE
jgi:hypothetical protein